MQRLGKDCLYSECLMVSKLSFAFEYDLARYEAETLLGSCILMPTLVEFLLCGLKGFSLTQVKAPAAFNCPVFNPP